MKEMQVILLHPSSSIGISKSAFIHYEVAMALRFTRCEIPDVILIEPTNLVDERGWFRENYKQSEFAAHGIPEVFVQENCSFSRQGVVRGLHYQKHPSAQGKLVTVAQGQVQDVAVDIRRGSPTYKQWISLDLDAQSGCMVYIPPGFAHGFCVLSEQAQVIYKVTCEYCPPLDRGILWNDPELGVIWHTQNALLSPKDARLPHLKDSDSDFQYGVR